MGNSEEDAIVDQAIEWHQALAHDDADWHGFTLWLEADPRHRAAFDDIALIEEGVVHHRDAIRAILPAQADDEDDIAPHKSRRWLIGTGIAAALAVVVTLPLLQSPEASPILYATDPGQTKTVTLADGSQVALSAASAISVTDHQQRIALTRGSAYFDIRHDPARQLTITASGYQVTDIGTRFAIDTALDRVAVAVAAGKVTVTPPRAVKAVTVTAGYRLSGSAGSTAPRLSPIASDSVGSWRSGRLIYDDAPLPMVAADISRYLGTPIVLTPSLDDKHFSGVLVIGNGSRLVPDLAGVAGLSVRRHSGTVVLGAGAS